MKTWERRQAERDEQDRTYYKAERFIEDMRADKVPDNFILSEGAFMGLYGLMQGDVELAREVAEKGALLILKADSGFEFNDVMEMAQAIAEESDG